MSATIGINGFGRIGRIVTRIMQSASDFGSFKLAIVNDIAEDAENLAYLYNYDSVYRSPEHKAMFLKGKKELSIRDKKLKVTSNSCITDVPWSDYGVDIVIDSSGVKKNVEGAQNLFKKHGVKKTLITHSPSEHIDKYVIYGINHQSIKANDRVISANICDSNAIAHPLHLIEKEIGIDRGFVTTLHPWLSYQNLVDAPLVSQSDPGHFWKDYSLGRSSTQALIPKDTTAVRALKPIMPTIAEKIEAISYRTPTAIVSSADMTLQLKKNVSPEDVCNLLKENYGAGAASKYIQLNTESLIGSDYIGNPHSLIVDLQWIKVNGNLLKLVVWYDNEWGYASRIVDLVRYLSKGMRS